MDFDKIKELKCPELLITTREVDSEDVKWGGLIDRGCVNFAVNHSREQLTIRKMLQIPIFSDEEMTGIPYIETKREKQIEHGTHCNYVDYCIEYQKVHLVKVSQRFGVKVLKQTEEKFCNKIKLGANVFHFMYDFEEKRWRFQQKPERFEEEKSKIDEFCKSVEVRELHKHYFQARKLVKREVQSTVLRGDATYREVLLNFKKLIDASKPFFELKNHLRELSDFAYEKMVPIIGEIEKKLSDLTDQTERLNLLDAVRQSNRSGEENKLIEQYADFLNRMKNSFYSPGYWINGVEIYPNICEFYNLSQKATTNRNEDTKQQLKKKILAENPGKSFIVY
ncbi:hypothetical protein [Sporosarcina koreensis]|uniref:Uncharacterized protein n=1 Tax=Sporosarcina koreensis TaxID=334735 RepID=A0ABW0TTW9_9BACL